MEWPWNKKEKRASSDPAGIKKELLKEGFETTESMGGGKRGEGAVVVGAENNIASRVAQMKKLGLSEEDLKKYEEEIGKKDLGSYIKNNRQVVLEEGDFSEKIKNLRESGKIIPGDGYWEAHARGPKGTRTIIVKLLYVDSDSNISEVEIDLSQVGEFPLKKVMEEIREGQEHHRRKGEASPEKMDFTFRYWIAEALSPMLKAAGFKNNGLRYFSSFSKELVKEIERLQHALDEKKKRGGTKPFSL